MSINHQSRQIDLDLNPKPRIFSIRLMRVEGIRDGA
jgi:hypothetical protein